MGVGFRLKEGQLILKRESFSHGLVVEPKRNRSPGRRDRQNTLVICPSHANEWSCVRVVVTNIVGGVGHRRFYLVVVFFDFSVEKGIGSVWKAI